MTGIRRQRIWGTILSMLVLTASGTSPAQEETASPQVQRDPEIGAPVTPFVFDGDVRDLPPPPQWKPGDPVKEIPRRFYPPPGDAQHSGSGGAPALDSLHEAQRLAPDNTSTAFTAPSRNFPGQGYTGVNPPDTVGAVGLNHYIQMINGGGGALVRIYDKAEPVPNQLANFSLDSLGSGSCANGFGDPVALYDRFADRWLLSEFSSSGNNLCVYISQTGNPVTGGWFNYTFTAPTFPDYPKYSVWPTDANAGAGSYVVTANDGGPGVYALDRGAMLAGAPGVYQRLTVPGLPGFGFEALTPADVDTGTLPPASSPGIVLRHRDTESHSGPAAPADLIELWAFDVDWVSPVATTLTALPSINVAEFDSSLCGLSSFNCFPQPGTGTTLDPLREVVMFRLVYVNHGDHESLVGNFVVDVNGSDHGGVRWFELRQVAGGGWSLAQEGTYAIDANHRFMAASAMDQSGNIAMAYNVSSSSTFPSLRYTGRLATDPPNVMTQAETSIHAGTASNSSNRYGDYAAMSLDPVDDCTFWFTGMDNTSSNWRTQIASFKFDACGCLAAPDPPVATAVANGDNRIDVSWDDSALSTVVEYRVRRATSPGGPYTTVATITDTSPGAGGGSPYTFQDLTVSGGTTYHYIVVSTDGVACTSDPSNEAAATATGPCTLPPTFAGVQSVTTPFSSICTLNLQWASGTAHCGGPLVYDVYRSTAAGFVPGPGNLLVPGYAGTTYPDSDALVSDVTYHYVVRAVDQATGIGEANGNHVSAVPEGTLTQGTWTDDAGDTGAAQMGLNGPWAVNNTEGSAGPKVYKTGTYNSNSCAGLVSPALQLGAGSVLTFGSRYDIETSWDKGEVQVSTNGGASWQRVPVNYPGNSTNAADNCGLPTGSYFTGSSASFASYTASLSAWNGQVVRLRFVLSTDPSVTANGWWIDDISVTNVDVPGICTTGSSCADNPFVDVSPQGPLTVCEGSEQILAANLTGGSGPFEYQWVEDGVDMPGETSATLSVDRTGAHAYNVRVKADLCEDDTTDGTATGITWLGAPLFDGIVSATNAHDATCRVDVEWVAASTVCPGPVVYQVYRETSTPVDPIPANRIAAGVTGTSFTDSDGLASGTIYHYLVRALDSATGQADANTAEAQAAPTGAGGGLQQLFSEDFSSAFGFSAWSVTTGPGPHSCGAWARASSAEQRPSGGSGFYALSDSDACESGSQTSTILTSPAINANIAGLQSATLDFDLYYNHYNGDDATVEAWNGTSWVVVWSDTDLDLNQHQTIDVTPFAQGNPTFRVRFNYQNAAYDWWYSVDNVVVRALINNVCETALSADPPPAPDGSLATTPLTASRATATGGVIDVAWDTISCTATDYNLIYGDLTSVASYALTGSACSIGTAGTHSWTGVPPGDLYFLIVGTDGNATESSWGQDSALAERNGLVPSGECSATVKSVSESCP